VAFLSRAMFGLAALVLMQGIVQPFAIFRRAGLQEPTAFLTSIGYVIIAIAVFDVAKFLVEEEVIHEREKRTASEARRSLTRFISAIAIAVFLEALVTVFRVSSDRVTEMLYPTLLLIAGTGLILGLGMYQRLSAAVERQVDERDRQKEEERRNGD
jgi:archaellum biogenesis protein FlaJ (TadC family)